MKSVASKGMDALTSCRKEERELAEQCFLIEAGAVRLLLEIRFTSAMSVGESEIDAFL